MSLERGFDYGHLAPQADYALSLQAHDAKIAKLTKDAGAISVTSKRFDTARANDTAVKASLIHLEDVEACFASAFAKTLAAQQAVNAGTLDEKKAVADARELVLASAAERFHVARHAAACAAVKRPLEALVNSATDAEGRARNAVLEATRSYLESMFSHSSNIDTGGGCGYAKSAGSSDNSSKVPVSRAQQHGRSSTAAQAVWWPIAEHIVMQEFLPRYAEATRLYKLGRANAPPTVADLERCFAARRAGLESARAAARAQISALENQIGSAP